MRHLYALTMTLPRPPEASQGALEGALVAAVRTGGMRPEAFRRPLLDASGRPGHRPHDRLEQMRCWLRDTIRGKKADKKKAGA